MASLNQPAAGSPPPAHNFKVAFFVELPGIGCIGTKGGPHARSDSNTLCCRGRRNGAAGDSRHCGMAAEQRANQADPAVRARRPRRCHGARRRRTDQRRRRTFHGGGKPSWSRHRDRNRVRVARTARPHRACAIISNSFVVLPLIRKLNYDPFTDFTPICKLADFPPLIAVNSDSPYRTLADLFNAARAQPATLTIGSIGPATSSQMAIEMIKYSAKINMTFVPFAGYTPAIQAVLGNQITAAYADYASLQAHLQSGKLRALVTTSRKRVAALPDIPTAVEAGYNVEEEFFGGVIAPANPRRVQFQSLLICSPLAAACSRRNMRASALPAVMWRQCAAILHKDQEDYKRIVTTPA